MKTLDIRLNYFEREKLLGDNKNGSKGNTSQGSEKAHIVFEYFDSNQNANNIKTELMCLEK